MPADPHGQDESRAPRSSVGDPRIRHPRGQRGCRGRHLTRSGRRTAVARPRVRRRPGCSRRSRPIAPASTAGEGDSPARKIGHLAYVLRPRRSYAPWSSTGWEAARADAVVASQRQGGFLTATGSSAHRCHAGAGHGGRRRWRRGITDRCGGGRIRLAVRRCRRHHLGDQLNPGVPARHHGERPSHHDAMSLRGRGCAPSMRRDGNRRRTR